jgi:hypothetical protein
MGKSRAIAVRWSAAYGRRHRASRSDWQRGRSRVNAVDNRWQAPRSWPMFPAYSPLSAIRPLDIIDR